MRVTLDGSDQEIEGEREGDKGGAMEGGREGHSYGALEPEVNKG